MKSLKLTTCNNTYQNLITTTRFLENTQPANKRQRLSYETSDFENYDNCLNDTDTENIPLPPPPPPPPSPFPLSQILDENANVLEKKSESEKTGMVCVRWRAQKLSNFKEDKCIWVDMPKVELKEGFVDAFSKPTKQLSQSNNIIKMRKPKKRTFVDMTNHGMAISIFFQKYSEEQLRFYLDNLEKNFDYTKTEMEVLSSFHQILQKSSELIKKIENYLKSNCKDICNVDDSQKDVLLKDLDIPDRSLYSLFIDSDFKERVSCLCKLRKIMFSLDEIEKVLKERVEIYKIILNSSGLKKVLSIILACGNTMNASDKWLSNQVQSFELDILTKLKEIKTRKYKSDFKNLLDYVVQHYNSENENNEFPLPFPIQFTYMQYHIGNILSTLNDIKSNIKHLDNSLNKTEKPAIIKDSVNNLRERLEILFPQNAELSGLFEEAQLVFCFKPKLNRFDEDFLMIWKTFSEDFYNFWKPLQLKKKSSIDTSNIKKENF